MSEIKANYIVEIAAAVPRRLTSYRGRTAAGTRGLIVDGHYYRAAILEIPGIEESDSLAPVRCSLSIGNADNAVTDLYSDSANHRKPVNIRRVEFSGVWDEALPPDLTIKPWFEGTTGKPMLVGERLVLECSADLGRRGKSPRTKSRTLMIDHQPLAAGHKLTIYTGAGL